MSRPWPEVPLSEIALAIKDGSHGSHIRSDGGIPLLSAKNVSESGRLAWGPEDSHVTDAEFALITAGFAPQAGDLLLTVVGSLGRRAIFDGSRVGFQRSVAFIRPDTKKVGVEYLFQAAGSEEFLRQLIRRSNATAQAGLYLGELGRVTVPLPPNQQQEAISSILRAADRTVDGTINLITKLEKIKAGLMQNLFTRGLDLNGRLRPRYDEAPSLYKDSPIGRIPKDWGLHPIRESGTVQLGRQLSPDQHTGKWTMPYLRVANVFDGYIDYSDVLQMDFRPAERKVFSLGAGDILLNEGQSLELVGRSALYDGPSDTYCFQNTLIRFRVNNGQCSAYYRGLFKWWLDTGRFTRVAKQTTSVAHLGTDRFARMMTPQPSLEEQALIAERLERIEKLLRLERQFKRKSEAIRSGLMNDLLSGAVSINRGELVHV